MKTIREIMYEAAIKAVNTALETGEPIDAMDLITIQVLLEQGRRFIGSEIK